MPEQPQDVKITNPVYVEGDNRDIVTAIGELTEAIGTLTERVEQSFEELRRTIEKWTP